VKTDLAPPPARYRNEAVFRSAERLLASSPKKRSWRPGLWQVLVFAGLAGGLIAVFWLRRPPREMGSAGSAADATANEVIVTSHGVNRPLEGAAPALGIPAAPTSALDHPAPSSRPENTPRAAFDPRSARPATARATARNSAPAEDAADHAPTLTWLVLARSTAGLRLRGELRSEAARPIPVEFQLYLLPGPLGGSVDGAVQFLDGPAQLKPVHVSGSWFNRTIVLREVDETSHGSTLSPGGYRFVLELPGPAESEKFTGAWSHGSNRVGILVLNHARP
jgi:hypothetical protein